MLAAEVGSQRAAPGVAAVPHRSGDALTWLGRAGPVILAGIVSLGLVVRVRQFCADPSYWYDEAYLLLNVCHKSCAELCGPLRCDQAAPPAFLWLLRGQYLWGGAAEWVMRLPALVASVAALFVAIPLARKIAGKHGWLWAAGFAALSYHAVTHAIEVKPYAFDLLMSELILWAAAACIAEPKEPAKKGAAVGLFAIALAAPWFSYPAVFVLGGVSIALATTAWIQRRRDGWLLWLTFNLVVALSFASVWLLAARFQRTASLEAYWHSAFIDFSSATGAITFIARLPAKIGDYGSTGLGIPLALLALWGAAMLWRQSKPLAFLLIGPIAVALLANALHRYPLDDRLLFFAAPCVWLAAAAGIGDILQRSRGRFVWPTLLLLAALLIPGAARAGKHVVVVKPKAEYREAFTFVMQNEQPGDRWWVSHPEVAEVYYGSGKPCLSGMLTADALAECATGRLWMVVGIPEVGPLLPPEFEEQLEAAGLHAILRRELPTVVVFMYASEASRSPP